MYYVPDQSLLSDTLQHNSLITIIISILTISPADRTLRDHQLVHQFFHNNQILAEIQRTKSLNAKQQCIANLQAQNQRPNPKEDEPQVQIIDRIIVQDNNNKKQSQIEQKQHKQSKQPKQEKGSKSKKQNKERSIEYYYVFINMQKMQEIINEDERYLRKNIDRLKTYVVLKEMKYNQLLHLAYYMDERAFKYKQEVYKEGDEVDYLYLVERGQFHFVKKMVSNDPVTHHNKSKNRSKPKRYEIKSDNPNRIKNSVSTDLKVGVIEGESGQSFGDEQIVAERLREYTVICMSTQNTVIRIPDDKYRRVINNSATKMNWIKKENQKKIQLKDDFLAKIISVKSNYKKYMELITNDNLNLNLNVTINKTENVRTKKDSEPNDNPMSTINKSMLPKIKSQSSVSEENYFSSRKSHKSINKSQVNEKDLDKDQQAGEKVIKTSLRSEEAEENTFDLTKVIPKKMKRHEKHTLHDESRQNISAHISIPTTTSNSALLPSILTDKHKAVSNHQSMSIKQWSASSPIIELRGLRNKFSGMIDANSLIKQKEQILNMKMMGKEVTSDVFELTPTKQVNRPVGNILTKQEVRQLRSAAHSKVFMQKLLVEALKKAGYNSDKNSQSYIQESTEAAFDIKNNLRVPKIKASVSKQSSLLAQNSFDECFFKQLE